MRAENCNHRSIMPKTRLATARYEVLDRCFSDKTRYYFIEDLVGAVNAELESRGLKPVSKRTVQKDIEDMSCDRNWIVEFTQDNRINGRRYYRYADPDYSIWRKDLNEHQLAQLKSMLLMLQQFRGLPQFERVEELISNLEEYYHITIEDSVDVIAFDTNDYVDGLQHLSPLFEAIVNKQALSITYCPFNKEPFTTVVHPYYIKQYNRRWFLFALTLNGPFQGISNMALDRIQAINPTTDAYIPNDTYDFDEYFEDIIGVSKPQASEVVKIILRFTEQRLPYVLSKPMHDSQRNHRAEEGIVELQLIPNNELYQRLLSFGSDVEVIEPQSVREQMALHAEKLYNLYKK